MSTRLRANVSQARNCAKEKHLSLSHRMPAHAETPALPTDAQNPLTDAQNPPTGAQHTSKARRVNTLKSQKFCSCLREWLWQQVFSSRMRMPVHHFQCHHLIFLTIGLAKGGSEPHLAEALNAGSQTKLGLLRGRTPHLHRNALSIGNGSRRQKLLLLGTVEMHETSSPGTFATYDSKMGLQLEKRFQGSGHGEGG